MDIDHKNCQTTCNKFVTTSIILITSSPLAHYIIGLDAKQLYLNVFEFQQHFLAVLLYLISSSMPRVHNEAFW